MSIECKGLKKKKKVWSLELQKKLEATTRHMNYYRNKLKSELKKQELVVDALEGACVKRIHSVRNFWKDKIYREGSRSGIILKRALQK